MTLRQETRAKEPVPSKTTPTITTTSLIPSSATPSTLNMAGTNTSGDSIKPVPENLTDAIDRAIDSKPVAEQAVLYLIERYQIDVNALLKKGSAHGQEDALTYCKPTYASMAPTFGLDPEQNMRDAPVHKIFRARIPTSVLKAILDDMHLSLNQYGPAEDHHSVEGRFRFLAPLMNRVIAQFKLLIQNFPEHIITGGHAYTANRFKVFGAINTVFIMDKFRPDSGTDRLNGIAQVMAELAICHDINIKAGVSPEISAILCDGRCFQFFSFNASTTPPVFSRGFSFLCDLDTNMRFDIPSFTDRQYHKFVDGVRFLNEVFYAVFLHAYVTGLETHEAKLQSQGKDSCKLTNEALVHARAALSDGIFAATLPLQKSVDSATEWGDEAFEKMRKSVDSAPKQYRRECELIQDWDDDQHYL